MLNDPVVRPGILDGACGRYGYPPSQVEFRLYVGKFAGSTRVGRQQVTREWCASLVVGGAPIRFFDVREVAARAREVANSKQYRDNPALVATKVLHAAGMLMPLGPTHES